MDQLLEEQLEKIQENPQVEGVICSDLKGLCIGMKGNVNERLAGQIASLHTDAITQWKDPPVIVIEMASPTTEKVLLTNLDGHVCTAIIKKVS